MGGQRKSAAKKPLPYKVLGKKLVDAHFRTALSPESISTVPVRSEWPKDDPRYEHAQEAARRALVERTSREKDPQHPPESTHRYVLK